MLSKPNPRWLSMALVAFGFANQACSSAAPKPPAPPPPAQARKAHEPGEQEPYHVAPPPAYGNKVVLAKADQR